MTFKVIYHFTTDVTVGILMLRSHIHVKLSCKSHTSKFHEWDVGTWLPCGNYVFYVAITGSAWLVMGLTHLHLLEGCQVHPVAFKYIPYLPRRPRNSHNINTTQSISWKSPFGFYGMAQWEGTMYDGGITRSLFCHEVFFKYFCRFFNSKNFASLWLIENLILRKHLVKDPESMKFLIYLVQRKSPSYGSWYCQRLVLEES